LDGATNTGAIFGLPVTAQQPNLIDHVTLYFVDGQRGDDDLTANGVIVEPGGPAFIASAPPRVASARINDGSPQRSKINSLTVEFDSRVSIDLGAFELRQVGVGNALKLNVAISEQEGQTLARMTLLG